MSDLGLPGLWATDLSFFFAFLLKLQSPGHITLYKPIRGAKRVCIQFKMVFAYFLSLLSKSRVCVCGGVVLRPKGVARPASHFVSFQHTCTKCVPSDTQNNKHRATTNTNTSVRCDPPACGGIAYSGTQWCHTAANVCTQMQCVNQPLASLESIRICIAGRKICVTSPGVFTNNS